MDDIRVLEGLVGRELMGGSSKRQGKAGSPLKNILLQAQEQSISVLRKASRLLRKLTWLSKEFVVELQCK